MLGRDNFSGGDNDEDEQNNLPADGGHLSQPNARVVDWRDAQNEMWKNNNAEC